MHGKLEAKWLLLFILPVVDGEKEEEKEVFSVYRKINNYYSKTRSKNPFSRICSPSLLLSISLKVSLAQKYPTTVY